MQLRQLLQSITSLRVDGSVSTEITGLAYEARRVTPGDLYFALQRPGFDGHTEVEIAISRGAVAVVCERNRCLRQRATMIEVADPRAAMAQAAAFFYGNPGEKLRVIGVSGGLSGWKTAFLLRSIFTRAGVESGLISSLRHEIGVRRLPSSGTLETLDIHRLFSEMVRARCTTCIIELPEVSTASLATIPLDVLIVQGGDQKYWWNTMDYLRHGAARRPTCGVIGLESAVGREAACGVLFEGVVTYGESSAAQVCAHEVSFSLNATEGTLYLGNERFAFDLPLVGRENLNALLGACAAALTCDLTAGQIAEALNGVSSLPGSLEVVSSGQGFTVFVDDARDEQTLEATLRSIRELTRHRILLAFGACERTSGKQRFTMGQIAARHCDYVVLTSDNPGREGVEQICSALAQGLEASGHNRYHFQPDRSEAIHELLAQAQPGDVLLVAGKGERTFQEFASTIVPFDDRIIAREYLSTVEPVVNRMRLDKATLVSN